MATCREEQRPTEICRRRKGVRVLMNWLVVAGLVGVRRGSLSPGPILAWILDLGGKIWLHILYFTVY